MIIDDKNANIIGDVANILDKVETKLEKIRTNSGGD